MDIHLTIWEGFTPSVFILQNTEESSLRCYFNWKRHYLASLITFTAKQPEGESPKFIQPLKSQEVFEGSPAKLDVRISGEPEPEIEWFKDQQPIEEGGNFRIEFDDTNGCALIINSTKLKDEGLYRCVASNSFGKAISEAELLVTGMYLSLG